MRDRRPRNSCCAGRSRYLATSTVRQCPCRTYDAFTGKGWRTIRSTTARWNPAVIDFSVVIPTYRRNKELAEALASVLRQGGVTFEVLVIDDCPDGAAKGVVDALKDSRVTYR